MLADGVAVTAERRKSWFKSIGWVSQNPQLSTGDVAHQFKLVDPDIAPEKISDLLIQCGLHISDLPAGLATPIGSAGESGNAASGGQVRKIALARALAATPKVLIADEPTADLDQVSSEAVMKVLREYAQSGAIVICITHDRSVLKSDDMMAVFSEALST